LNTKFVSENNLTAMAKNKNSNSAERKLIWDITKKTQIFYKFVRLYIFRVAKSEMRLHFIRNMKPGKVFHVKSPEKPL